MAYRGAGRGMRWRAPDSSQNHYPQSSRQYHNTSHDQHLLPADNSNSAMDVWIGQLKSIWSLWKKSEGVTKMLHEFFASAPNPYAAMLFVMPRCDDFHQSKQSSLTFTVVEEFCRWVADKETALSHLLSPEIKKDAFNLVLQQRNFALNKLVFSVFQLSNSKELFIEPIKELISRKQYKEACQCATLLRLHDEFCNEDFVIPLVFQDKLSIAEEFLAGSQHHQQQLVSFLDSLLGKRNARSEAENYIRKLDIPDVKKDKLYHKPLSKLVARLTKLYSLSPDVCPNLNQKRNEGALQFLVHKRYYENTLGQESWREMVREAVGDNKELHIELLALVNTCGDPQEALYWAHFFDVPKQKWPYNVRMLQEDGFDIRNEQGAAAALAPNNQENVESWDNDSSQISYHKFSLPRSCIVLVNNEKSFREFLDYIRTVPMVGIDSEWKPFFGTRRNELALIQIATRERVYILDVCTLGSQCQTLWHELGATLFANENIIKLGFGLVTDMNMIKSSLPYLTVKSLSGAGYIDMVTLWKKLINDHPFIFPYSDEDNATGESLSRLVFLCLGQTLDKSDQFSNWERRPLRESQVLYAALDAFCLLEIFDVLQKRALEQNIPFHEVCNEIMSEVKSPHKVPKHSKKSAKHENQTIEVHPSPHTEPTPARDFKVVCDNMIHGLGKMLRKCGIDTEILENEDNHDVCVRIAQQQNRMIITRGQIYNRLHQHVPKGHCYPVFSDILETQLEEVLKYFNVVVTKDDIFSRCQICNGGEFVIVPHDVMQRLAQASQRIAQLIELEEDSRWDDYGEGFSSESDAYSEEGSAYPVAAQSQNLESGVYIDRCLTRKRISIKVDAVPVGVLNQVQLFHICENCGKCYWDGSHFERLVGGRLQNIVS